MLLSVLVFASCSTLFGERAKPVDSKGEPIEVKPKNEEVIFTGPQSFEEEYPFVRFINHDDGTLTAILTVPKGAGANVETQLRFLCVSLRDEAPKPPSSEAPIPPPEDSLAEETPDEYASIRVVAGGGMVYDDKLDNEVNRTPWGVDGNFKSIEDLVVVTGTEDHLREVFEALDIWFNSGPQISIEAVVTENLTNESFERGLIQLADTPLFNNTQGSAFLRNIGGQFPSPSNPNPNGSGSSGVGGAFQLGLLDSSFQLDAVIQLLETEGLVGVISQPSIVTRNGVTARVESIEQIPFLDVQTMNFSGAATFAVGTKSVGVKMYVTPFLIGVDTIHLVIDVEVSRLGQDFVIGTDGNNQSIFAPSLNTRTASTEVYVRNGTHVIIGGLRLTENRVSESKVPLLGDLPILGWLFSSRSTEEAVTNVTFMFTPRIKQNPSIDRFGDYLDPFDDAEAAK